MPLVIEIEGRAAIPVRALPFVTHGTFSAAALVELFYDPESHADHEFSPPVSSHCLDPTGKATHLPASKWKIPRDKLAVGSPTFVAQLEALLPGAFVWRDEFKSFFDFLARKQEDAEALGFRQAPAGEFGWDEDEIPSPAEASLIFENLESFAGALRVFNNEPDSMGAGGDSSALPAPASIRNSRFQWDFDLQDKLEAEANKYREDKKKVPPKKTLASDIADKMSLSAGTIERRTRKPWAQRK